MRLDVMSDGCRHDAASCSCHTRRGSQDGAVSCRDNAGG
jgi:hypothetical protein